MEAAAVDGIRRLKDAVTPAGGERALDRFDLDWAATADLGHDRCSVDSFAGSWGAGAAVVGGGVADEVAVVAVHETAGRFDRPLELDSSVAVAGTNVAAGVAAAVGDTAAAVVDHNDVCGVPQAARAFGAFPRRTIVAAKAEAGRNLPNQAFETFGSRPFSCHSRPV